MNTPVLTRLRTGLSATLGCSGLALAIASLTPTPAQAAALIWATETSNPNQWTAGRAPTFDPDLGLYTVEQVFPETGTINGVRIRIRFTPFATAADTTNAPGILNSSNAPAGEDRFNNLVDSPDEPPGTANGGIPAADSPSILAFGYASTSTTNIVRVDVIYEDINGDPIPVENARFAIVDVDSDSGSGAGGADLWRDQVAFFGYLDSNPVLPGETPAPLTPNLSGTSPPGVPLPSAPATPTYTITGNVASGNPSADAPNDSPNGNLFVEFLTQPITQARFDYGYDPASAGPNAHGIGFYNFDFSPVLIGTSKEVTDIQEEADGTFTITYQVVVENYGEVDLQNVEAIEDLTGTFGGAGNFDVTDIRLVDASRTTPAPSPGGDNIINTSFDGDGEDNLLTGGVTLAGRIVSNLSNNIDTPGGSVTIEFDVNVDPDVVGLGPFQNQVEARGTSPNGTDVTDLSNDGGDIDQNNNGTPTDDNTPTVTSLAPTQGGQLTLVKRITNIFRRGTPLTVQGITSFNNQSGDNNDTALRDAFVAAGVDNQPAGIFELPDGFELQPDDEVEYTIYFWNSSTEDITAVEICDELEPPSVLNVDAGFELSPVGPLAIPAFVDAGGTVQGQSPGATLADFCISAPGSFPFGPPGPPGGLGVGAGGGVTTDPFDMAIDEFGAIRFRVRIP